MTIQVIDADALQRHKQLEAFGNGQYENVEIVYGTDIDNAPIIDAVQVVRCKDCVLSFRYDNGITYCAPMGLEMQPTDFYSHGERRDNE